MDAQLGDGVGGNGAGGILRSLDDGAGASCGGGADEGAAHAVAGPIVGRGAGSVDDLDFGVVGGGGEDRAAGEAGAGEGRVEDDAGHGLDVGGVHELEGAVDELVEALVCARGRGGAEGGGAGVVECACGDARGGVGGCAEDDAKGPEADADEVAAGERGGRVRGETDAVDEGARGGVEVGEIPATNGGAGGSGG